MKACFSCFKGGGSASNVVEDPPEQPQPPAQPQQPQRVRYENDEINEEAPFGNNVLLNNAWRNNTELPDDRGYADSSYPLFPTSPPLPADCGESFPWHEILDGTLNFRQKNFLGRGNFGEVYRCDFPRIDKVGAAKIQNPENPDGHREFLAEVTTLHAANHPNVIKLLGKCYGCRSRAVVYEFMPNGSLERYLSAAPVSLGQRLQQGTRVLDWETRMKIALGVAEGLVNVHMELKAIHRDIKPGNILLDQNFVPKLTDFGLATRIDEDENGNEKPKVITPIKGTPGFIAPETHESGLVSTKSDVYSYGILLLQLFTGRKAFDGERPEATRKLADWFRSEWRGEQYTRQLVDVVLRNEFPVKGLNTIFLTARRCIGANARSRPDMEVVVTMVREAAAYQVPGGTKPRLSI